MLHNLHSILDSFHLCLLCSPKFVLDSRWPMSHQTDPRKTRSDGHLQISNVKSTNQAFPMIGPGKAICHKRQLPQSAQGTLLTDCRQSSTIVDMYFLKHSPRSVACSH